MARKKNKRLNSYRSKKEPRLGRLGELFDRWYSVMIQVCFFLLVLTLCYMAWIKLSNPNAFPIRTVKVVAQSPQIDRQAIQTIVKEHLNGGFFLLNTSELRQRLLARPWVKSVSLTRVWPNRLNVTVDAKTAVARWGKAQLMTDDGQLFQPGKLVNVDSLPQLSGPLGSEADVLAKFQLYQKALSVIGLQVKALSESNRLSWRLITSNNIEVMLGVDNEDQHLALFVQLYPRLIAKRADQCQRVDMRYPNGMAIAWKSGHP